MGFGGHVTIDTVGSPEPLYQNVKGDSPTPRVHYCEVHIDKDNTGDVVIAPFPEASASSPRYGGHQLEGGEVLYMKAEGGDVIDLQEWYVDTEGAGNMLRWIVPRGAVATETESVAV